MELGLRDRVYVITGGTSGLGRATAEALVADGAHVVVSSRDSSKVERAVDELGGAPVARGVVADNADPATAARLVAAAQETFGRLDGALISVGGPPPAAALDATDEQWQQAFESVFLGAVRLARTIGGHLTEGGAIGFVLSSSVRQPIPGLAISNGLRPGLAMVAKTLADELGPRGVRVVSLLPGHIATPRQSSLIASEDDRRRIAADSVLRRIGEPTEFGRVAAFALSPAASYVTGCTIPVDGGWIRGL